MAKQLGPNCRTGTRIDLTCYCLNGSYYARKKSTLSRQRVRKSPAFRQTMISARALGHAARIASRLYKLLPPHKRLFPFFRRLTGHAYRLIKKKDRAHNEIFFHLRKKYIPTPQPTLVHTLHSTCSPHLSHIWYTNTHNTCTTKILFPPNATIIQQKILI